MSKLILEDSSIKCSYEHGHGTYNNTVVFLGKHFERNFGTEKIVKS